MSMKGNVKALGVGIRSSVAPDILASSRGVKFLKDYCIKEWFGVGSQIIHACEQSHGQ